jgi:hypothetical protein
MDNESMIQKTMGAVRVIFSNPDVSPGTTKADLQGIVDEIEVMISTLPDDVESEDEDDVYEPPEYDRNGDAL